MATQRPVHIDATSGNVRELVAGDKLGGITNGTATGEALTFDAIGVSVQAYSASTTLLGNTVTGTGSIVLATSPTLVTPVLGVASATSLACPTLTSAAAMTLTPASTNDVIVATSGATASLRISGAAATATTALTFYNAVNSAGNRNWAIAQNQHVYADLHFMQSNAKDGNPISAGTTALCIDPNRNVGVGTTSPSARVHAISTTEQLRLGYDSSNYLSTTVSSAGLATLAKTGTNASITLTPSGTGNVIMSKIPRFNGTNSTGAGSSLLGANSPATTLTAPYTWISVITSDGSTAYIPCWK